MLRGEGQGSCGSSALGAAAPTHFESNSAVAYPADLAAVLPSIMAIAAEVFDALANYGDDNNKSERSGHYDRVPWGDFRNKLEDKLDKEVGIEEALELEKDRKDEVVIPCLDWLTM